MGEKMTTRMTWTEFRTTGMLWWINCLLHMMGWAICYSYDDNGNFIEAYPARVKFRGFGENDNTAGYIKVTNYMEKNAADLLRESKL